MDKEIWKSIDGYPNYLISESGKIYSMGVQRILKQDYSGGYRRVTIFFFDKRRFLVHRLVAREFVPNPNNYKIVNHKDGNKLNCHYTNLEWCTQSQNVKHAFDTGLKKPSENQKLSVKKSVGKKVVNIVTGQIFLSARDAAKSIGIGKSRVNVILNNESINKTNLRYL